MTPQPSKIEIPDLRVLPIENLLLHEQNDTQRSRPLAGRLIDDGVLLNPPIVAPLAGQDRFVVLDGANRVTALSGMGMRHVLAQVVDYADARLVLDTWYHLVGGMQREEFHQGVERLPDVALVPADLIRAREALARREALAYVVYANGDVVTIRGEGDVHRRTARLNDVVDIYKSRGRIHRVNTDHMERLVPFYESVTALVVFPCYQPAEILELASDGERLPAGITRHLIPGRALRLNFPLALLREDRTLAEKNAVLRVWLKGKMASRQARYYEESTYLFDE